MERQILEFLGEISLPERFRVWAARRIERTLKAEKNQYDMQKQSLLRSQAACAKELDTLTKLRIRDLLTDDEYLKQRQEIERQQAGIAQKLAMYDPNQDRFEPAQTLISVNNRLISCFKSGDLHQRRFILNTVGSNLVLKDQKLSIDVRKPFRRWSTSSTYSEMRAYLEDIRTFLADHTQEAISIIASVRQLLKNMQDDRAEKINRTSP